MQPAQQQIIDTFLKSIVDKRCPILVVFLPELLKFNPTASDAAGSWATNQCVCPGSSTQAKATQKNHDK